MEEQRSQPADAERERAPDPSAMPPPPAAVGRGLAESSARPRGAGQGPEFWSEPAFQGELLEGLLAGLVDPVVMIDRAGLVLRASASTETLLGWPPSELIGRNVSVLIPEPHGSQHDTYLARYLATGRTWILDTPREFDVLRRDGSLVACELTISRIDLPGRSRAAPLFSGTLRDVSERRRAHAALVLSEARFRAVFEHENELVLLLDDDDRVTDVNLCTLAHTGRSRESLVGQRLEDLQLFGSRAANGVSDTPADPSGGSPVGAGVETLRRAFARARTAGVATARLSLWTQVQGSAGAERVEAPYELSVRVLAGLAPGLPRTIVEIRDIGELVAAERRESSILRSLARVGEESAVLAHELRSPVSALELALKAVARTLGADERLLLDDLRRRMRRLEDLLRRTLSFSRPLELHLAPVSPAEAFGLALERESASLARAHVRASVQVAPETPALTADPRALDDLLANVLRNAAEAQPTGGAVRLAAVPSDPGLVRLTIDDEGPGIALSEREEVLRPFRTTKPDGTGLGLALVRKIAEEHGATLILADAPTGGLRILLDWPAHTPQPANAP